MGMKMAFNLSLKRGFVDNNYYNQAIELIEHYDIAPKGAVFDKEKFYDEMFLDKKAQGRHNFLNLRPMFAE